MLHTKYPCNHSVEDILRNFIIYRNGGHLGHVTIVISVEFHFNVPESLHTKFDSNGPAVSEKSQRK